MQALNLQGTEQTPSIRFNTKKSVLEISGKSIPEDAMAYYKPVMEWISEYRKEVNTSITLVIKFDYFDTPTAKVLFDILTALEKIEGSSVLWMYAESDQDMEESGLDFAELVNIPFKFKPY